MSISETIKKQIRKLKRLKLQKMHLEYITGLLSIPVLLTAIIINFGNINNQPKNVAPTPVPTEKVIIIDEGKNNAVSQLPTNSPVCKKSIGPISIKYPSDGQTVSDNPVCFIIEYPDTDYCSVVWSYKINNGSWSDYNNGQPCLYNLPNGNVQFQLRVNSTVSSETKTITRNFVYNGSPVSPTSPTATGSATTN